MNLGKTKRILELENVVYQMKEFLAMEYSDLIEHIYVNIRLKDSIKKIKVEGKVTV